MKKILCILLSVALIAAAIPMLTVSSSAAGGTVTVTCNGEVLGEVEVGNEFIYNVALDSAGYSPQSFDAELRCTSNCVQLVEYGAISSSGAFNRDAYSLPTRIRNAALVCNYNAQNALIKYNFTKGTTGVGEFTTADHFFKVRFKAVKAGTAEIKHYTRVMFLMLPDYTPLYLIRNNQPNEDVSPAPYTVSTVEAASAYIGDANGDYALNVLDATFIQRMTAGVEGEYKAANADVDRDGDVDLKDALLIARYQAGIATDTQVGEWIFDSEQIAVS